jgi:hypothetical protein
LKVRLIEILLPLTFSILLLVISYTPVLTTTAAAQINSIETNRVEAVQQSSHNGTDYLRAKILIKGVELSAGYLLHRNLWERDWLSRTN